MRRKSLSFWKSAGGVLALMGFGGIAEPAVSQQLEVRQPRVIVIETDDDADPGLPRRVTRPGGLTIRPIAGHEAGTVQAVPIQAGTVQVFGGSEAPRMAVTRMIQAKLPSHYLGLSCAPADEVLKAHLPAIKDGGLVVDQVSPDSPAAKAGVQRHDILLRAGDVSLTDINKLFDAIEKSGERELSITLLRNAKETTVKVTPTKRPAEAGRLEVGRVEAGPDVMIERAVPRWFDDRETKLRFFGPGMVVPPDMLIERKFPKGLNISVNKDGDAPAKITVKQGDKTWEVTEKELNKLPEEIRPHVAAMLGQAGKFHLRLDATDAKPIEGRTLTWPTMPSTRAFRVEGAEFDPEMKRMLKEMRERMEKMEREFGRFQDKFHDFAPDKVGPGAEKVESKKDDSGMKK